MPQFSKRSLARLASCDARLQMVCNAAIERTDFTVLCGYRSEAEQADAFERGMSKLRYPQSKHNKWPSRAVDLAPWPIDWNDIPRFVALADIMLEEAKRLGVNLRWGGDWNRNGDWRDEKFRDMPHYQLED